MNLSIIVPTYNERGNLEELATKVFNALELANIDGELIIVDDNSPDGTGELAEKLKEKYNMQIIHRKDKLGLASAVIDGFKAARADVLCVMDADLSHPPSAIREMFSIISRGEAPFVIGSRFIKSFSLGNWPWYRRIISWTARILARPITSVVDLTSGFFMIKRDVIEGVKLNPLGFKICLEILGRGKYRSVKEVPILFVDRREEKSKMGISEIFAYLKQLWFLYRDRKERCYG